MKVLEWLRYDLISVRSSDLSRIKFTTMSGDPSKKRTKVLPLLRGYLGRLEGAHLAYGDDVLEIGDILRTAGRAVILLLSSLSSCMSSFK